MNKLDQVFADRFTSINPPTLLRRIKVTNSADITTKLQKHENPNESDFQYPDLSKELGKIEDKIRRLEQFIKQAEGPIGILDVYLEKARQRINICRLILARGTQQAETIGFEIFDKVTPEEYEEAKRTLENLEITPIEELKLASPEQVKTIISQKISELGLDGWKASINNSISPNRIKCVPDPVNKSFEVQINPESLFAENEILELALHELSHVLRRINGTAQKLKILEKGTANHPLGAEGLAKIISPNREQSKTGKVYEREVLPEIRIISIYMSQEGASLQEIFNKLKEYGCSDQLASETAIRTKRGVIGTLAKDAIYFKGEKQAQELTDEDRRYLWAGKLKPSDIPQLKEHIDLSKVRTF